ncbi:hypothetical protein [Phyllobacterium myrsinacearum]|uniref:Uncharacterized protein n=1 Tax=Phyllobacterium myrsinacearum TaxID=28101 RepID=A0A2S9JHS7_9HYPH|nr:hypothetical protein [Phyllobacterium myrsinacearum]PRD52427.1 hypothetical protein C5750_16200 [Phyllobacterium myrsinacearum]
MIPLFWDQWEFAIDLAKSKQDALSLQYFFKAHNEHVIATTKLLFFLDYYFFSLTNGPLVVSIGIATFCVAWLLAKLLFINDKESRYFYPFFLLFSASGFSLAQWENLLWGFQPQFYLVLIFTLMSCLIGLKISDREQVTPSWWFTVLIVTTGLGVFSMGNGIALPVSIVILFVLRRYRPVKTVLYAFIAALFIGALVALTRGAPTVGDPALKTLGNLMSFFFGMLGSPISSRGVFAAICGVILFGAFGILFLFHILMPFLRRRPLDEALVGLFAFASFLFATAVGATWGRTALGTGAALASRYSTPMLVLWMTLFAILFRVTVISDRRPSHRQLRSGLWIILALGVAAWTSFRPGNIAGAGQANAANQAGYFLSSGVGLDEQLLKLYPSPSRIRPAIDYLRNAKLNLFAESPDLSASSWKQWTDKPAQACELEYVDKVQRLSASAWQAVGWVTNAARQTPSWIVAVDSSQNVLGYTVPLQPRSDVVKAVGLSDSYRGFTVPINMTSANTAFPISLLAIFGEDESPCRINLPPLPNGPFLIQPGELAPLRTEVVHSGATASPGIPPVLSIGAPYEGSEISGTWVSSDENVGKITYNVLDTSCQSVILPILRGPSAEGLSLVIKSNGKMISDDTKVFDSLQPHLWQYLQISAFDACKEGEKLNLSITLEDNGRGWGAWGAMATPGLQR